MTSFSTIQHKIDQDLLERNINEEFEDNMLLTSLYFAQLAYFSPAYIQKRLAAFGPIVSSVYRRNGIQVFFAEFDSFVVVAFKGQENDKWHEIITDLQFWKTEFKGQRVHAGIAKSLGHVSRRLHIDLDEAEKEKRVLYTGHSLGGSLAMLMGLEYLPTDIFTFGAAKVFDPLEAAEHYEHVNIVRVVNRGDFVVNLPPKWSGYGHLGEEVLMECSKSRAESHRLRSYLTNIIKERFVYGPSEEEKNHPEA